CFGTLLASEPDAVAQPFFDSFFLGFVFFFLPLQQKRNLRWISNSNDCNTSRTNQSWRQSPSRIWRGAILNFTTRMGNPGWVLRSQAARNSRSRRSLVQIRSRL